MNKYSSKAVKTAATVGMSLAMVLGNVAPVLAVTPGTVCKVEKKYAKGDVYATKTIAGTKDVDTLKADLAKTLNGLPKTEVKEIAGKTVTYKLGYKADSSDITFVEGEVAADEFTGSSVEYGYYADGRYEIKDEETGRIYEIGNEEALEEETVVSLAERDQNAVKQDINDFLNGLGISSANYSGSALTDQDMEVTGINGKPAEVKVDVTVEGDINDTDDVKVVVKAAASETGFAVYDKTDCETTGNGLGISSTSNAKNVYNEIVAAFEKADVSFETVKPGDKVEFTKTNTQSLGTVEIIKESTKKLDIEFRTVLKELATNLDNTTDEAKAVERLLELDDAMNDMFKAGGYLAQAQKYDEDTEFKTTAAYATAVELLEDFNDFDTYVSNLSEPDAEKVNDAKSILEDLVDGYVAENDGDLLDAYLTKLDDYYELFVEAYKDKGVEKSNVDKAIKDIKTGGSLTYKDDTVTLAKSDYTTFKDNSGVEEYMTKFEEMYDEIQAVKDSVAKSNEAYKALTEGDTSVKDFLTNKDKDREVKKFSDVKSQITVDEFKILKTYKEEVLDAVLTMDTKQVGNSYVNKTEKSMFATASQLNTVLNNIGNGTDLTKGVFTTLDKETGEFNWDKLVAHMEKVEASLEAVTTGIDKLDAISLTANDREAILAADDAVYFLLGDGADNLTSAQTRTVKNADRKVAELMEAYRKNFGSLNVELNGWINKGNGDYAYYENGIAPAYKWVPAGSDWYFVKDGVMMRNYWLATDGGRWYYLDNEGKMVKNQSVDGCWINSYGVYMSPSYNG